MQRFLSAIVKLTLLTAASFLLTGCSVPFLGKKKQAALQITTTPKATVFLDGEHIGTSPFFDEKIKPGEYILKLIPEDGEAGIWEGKVKLASGILTAVSRELAGSPDFSSGYILSLEPVSDKKMVSLAVVTDPNGAVVSLDSEPKGFSPLSLDGLSAGEHLLAISSPGYGEKSLKAKLVEGHKLTATVQLAKTPEEEKKDEEDVKTEDKKETKTPSAKKTDAKKEATGSAETTTEEDEMERPYIKVKDTPTGWLNVRSEPSTAGKDETVVTKINPGEVYAFVEKNNSGWYKIELTDGDMGWISSRYAELYE